MSSTYLPRPLPYQPIANPTAKNPIGFDNTGDPRKATQNQRQLIQGQGDALQANDADLANQYRTAAGGTESYLNNVEDPLAQGNGGYNAAETSQINYSPEEQQRLVTGAGITAGAGTASAVGAAERAAAATGGNPQALATYRARAAQTQGALSGDAMTQARIAAKGAASQGAQITGNARLGQQNQALQYYQGLQGQQNQNAQNEQGLQHGAYGTQAGATNDATKSVVAASQTPSTFDKILGAASGAVSGLASKLADGTAGYLGHDDGGIDAIVGEDGPEAIVEAASRPTGPRGAMADGGIAPAEIAQGYMPNGRPYSTGMPGNSTTGDQPLSGGGGFGSGISDIVGDISAIRGLFGHSSGSGSGGSSGGSKPATPMADGAPPYLGGVMGYQPPYVGSVMGYEQPPYVSTGGETEYEGGPTTPMWEGPPPGRSQGPGEFGRKPNILQRVKSTVQSAFAPQTPQGKAGQQQQPQWNKATPYRELGQALGSVGNRLLQRDSSASDSSGSGETTMAANGRAPVSYRACRMADGGMVPRPPTIITSPTRVHLDQGDAVVPLSYRAKAKVRPSYAMAAMGAQPRG